jgi:cytochrome bd-type quinol oxidase subunit 1
MALPWLSIVISSLMIFITFFQNTDTIVEVQLLGMIFTFSLLAYIPLFLILLACIALLFIRRKKYAEHKWVFLASVILPAIALTLFNRWMFSTVF